MSNRKHKPPTKKQIYKDKQANHKFLTRLRRYCKDLEIRCRRCGSDSICILHHIIPLSKGGENKLSNLVHLCPNCHKEVNEKDITLSQENNVMCYVNFDDSWKK